jgi:hypothetical protein
MFVTRARQISDFETDSGTARLIDFTALRDNGTPQLVRIVHGEVASVP